MFIRLEDIAKILVGEWSCMIDNHRIDIKNDEELAKYKNYVVVSINAEKDCINLEIEPLESPTTKICSDDEWFKEYQKQFGTEPSSF